MPRTPASPPRVLDPRAATKPSRSMMRVMSSPSRCRLTSTAMPSWRWSTASGSSAECQNA